MNKKDVKLNLSARLTLKKVDIRVLTVEQLASVAGAERPPTSSIKLPLTCA